MSRGQSIHAVFAPDWRDGVPYQRLLAEALGAEGVEVGFLRDYRRILPLTRLLAPLQREGRCDFLHLHWPEAYYPRKGDGLDWFRRARFTVDLALATRRSRLAVTAHNLHAHNREHEPFAFHNTRTAFRRSAVVFAHSPAAADALVRTYGLKRERICVIPHGDISAAMPPPPPRTEARQRLAPGAESVCLLFGAVEPYKGIEDVLEHWRKTRPKERLVVAGKPITPEYGAEIECLAAGIDTVSLHLQRLSDDDLAGWLTAADCAVFNYRTIFTSGAANLARSWGLPVVLPTRLTTVDLHDPSPFVHRFDEFGESFAGALAAALRTTPSFAAAAEWRRQTSWPEIARQTSAAYRKALA